MPAPALILASASPRRAALLRSVDVEFVVHAVDTDERWHPDEHPLAYVERVAAGKARAGARAAAEAGAGPGAMVLAADTTVWFEGSAEPLAKPRDRDHAREMLRSLTRGLPHRVTTACVFARVGHDAPTLLAPLIETTEVRMRALSDAAFDGFIPAYLARAAWADKAGGYAIQGRAAALVTGITGSYTAVVGLPLAQVVARLEQLRQVEPLDAAEERPDHV